jgi:hypothetical protein
VYNSTKSGVDTLEEKCASYTTSRKTRRWPMAVFCAMLDIAGVKAHIIYNSQKPEKTWTIFHFY